MSACQTLEDASVTNTGSWGQAPAPRLSAKQVSPGVAASAPTFRDRPAAEPALVEGTGRFVGDSASASQQSSTASSEDGVTLNLVNVPVQQAANTILSDIIGVKYTIDPKIDGRVTIQTPAPVAKLAAVDLFQSALRANNAAIVSAGGLYRIVPLDQAPVGAVIQTASVPTATATLGSSVRVVQLKYVAASEMRRILEPIAPRGALVRADDARRTLTLSGTSQDHEGHVVRACAGAHL
jgi:general secretion pathway protein D